MRRVKQIISKNGRFFLDYIKFNNYISTQNVDVKEIKTDNRQCVVVLPWMGTAVSWYAITMALMLNRQGQDVFILLDDIPFGDDELFHKVQSKLIYRILNKTKLPFKLLSDYKDSNSINDDVLNQLSELNSLHYTKGETNKELRTVYEKKILKQLSTSYSKQETFFINESFSQIILPGGIWGSSGISSFFAKKHNVQLTTYDSGESLLLLSIFGVAAQLNDIPYSFNKVMESQDEKNFAIEKGKEQLQKRRNGQDMYQHFGNSKGLADIPKDYYLILLNSVWDSAALGLHTVYESMIDWIFDSIKWVLENTDKKIIIRQHPAERASNINNTDAYGAKIQDKFSKNERVIFIEAKNDVNTYELIENSLCVLGFSSTSIVEAVALGKTSIIVSSTYYADFGIVHNANRKKEYYDYLLKASTHSLEVTEEMIDRAYICNYITQSCNWYKTKFTPNRNDFLKWSKQNIKELEKDCLPLKAILEDIPVSTLQHRRKFNDSK
jgi:hypothetical protein